MTHLRLELRSLRQISRPAASIAAALAASTTGPAGVVACAPQSVKCPAPWLADQRRNASLFFPRGNGGNPDYAIPITAQRIDVVSDTDVIGPKFVVRDLDGHVFEETLWNPAHLTVPPFSAATISGEPAWVAARDVAPQIDEAILLGTPWAHNYHHWLINSLGRLAAIDGFPELRDLPCLVPGPLTAWQRESLAWLGVDEARLRFHAAAVVRCGRLVIPSGGDFSPTILHWLRRQATTTLPMTGSPGRRLYISRADAQQRRVINEDEIRSELTRRGFDILVPNATTFREQVRLCASAAFIVGPHGAGLTNAVFAAPGATLIEFHPADEMNHVFWLQASASGQRYGMVSGDVVNPRRDQFVPLPALIELLERCGCVS
jgi:hypothetical protein